jgi:hypothetical protein
LLTYNANTNTEGRSESGTTTGVASYAEAAGDETGRSVAGPGFSGPFAIGAGDMLRWNGFEGTSFFELSQLKKGITVLE